jgi:hypothetical protein
MADFAGKFLLEDGVSRLLLEDGVSFLRGEGELVYWNPDDKHASWTLSESNLLATVDASGGDHGIRATAAKSSGKHYFELKRNSGHIQMGLASASQGLTDAYSTNHTAVWYSFFGWVWANNAWADFGSNTISDGDWLAVAVDLDAGKIWFRTPAGWTSGDPAAGTGGYSIANFSDLDLYPYLMTEGGGVNAGSVTANFGGSAFNYAVPSGFEAWVFEAPETLYKGANWAARYKGTRSDAALYLGAGVLH